MAAARAQCAGGRGLSRSFGSVWLHLCHRCSSPECFCSLLSHLLLSCPGRVLSVRLDRLGRLSLPSPGAAGQGGQAEAAVTQLLLPAANRHLGKASPFPFANVGTGSGGSVQGLGAVSCFPQPPVLYGARGKASPIKETAPSACRIRSRRAGHAPAFWHITAFSDESCNGNFPCWLPAQRNGVLESLLSVSKGRGSRAFHALRLLVCSSQGRCAWQGSQELCLVRMTIGSLCPGLRRAWRVQGGWGECCAIPALGSSRTKGISLHPLGL